MTESPRWNIAIALVALLLALTYFTVARASFGVRELLKDTFEPFDLTVLPLERDLQILFCFSLIGAVTGLTGGLLTHDLAKKQSLTGKLIVAFGNLGLWLVFTASILISFSVFYHAFIDV